MTGRYGHEADHGQVRDHAVEPVDLDLRRAPWIAGHAGIISFIPVQIAAGVCAIVKDDDGKVMLDAKGGPVRKARYEGVHALWHFFASGCVNNRKADGGLELPGKVVQERLGHSSIAMTMDTYGHLIPAGR